MTLKQMARYRFLLALEAYRTALQSGTGRDIVITSIQVWAARSDVPKSWHAMINRTFRETKRAAR